MKRILVFMSALMFVLVIVGSARAEMVESARWGIDWTPVLVAVISVLTGLLARIWRVYARPWLESKGLTEAARIVVDAVEAAVGRGKGTEKWDEALKKMEERGFDIDSQAVLDALQSAWLYLDLCQISTGAKAPPLESGLEFKEGSCLELR